MTDSTTPSQVVSTAAARLVDAFARFDRETYFDCFAPDASFLFYNADQPFTERSAYEAAWDEWTRDGWRVLGCASTNARVQMVDDTTAVFTHDVLTEVESAEGPATLRERETIVFTRRGEEWLAVHEHLSPSPA